MTPTIFSWLTPADSITLTEFLTNYTFRAMLIGTTLIGVTSGALGSFLYLRKQSLISDVIGHSAIAGVMAAFIVAVSILGIEGRSMLVLTIGAVISSTIAVLVANWMTQTGPIVVLLLFLIFLISLAFAPERSVLRRAVMRRAKARELEAIARGEITFEEARALQNQSDFSRGRQPAPLGRKEPAPTHPGGAN